MTNLEEVASASDIDIPALSKRERNKQATREAIAIAALELAKQHGYDNVTVDMVADAADISRRTFFNYFSSLDEAITEWTRRVLDRAVEEMRKLPPELPVMEAALLAFQALAHDESLKRVAELAHVGATSKQLHVPGFNSCQECAEKIRNHFLELRPDIAPFDASVFAQVIVGACISAFHSWGETVTSNPTSEDFERLQTLIHRGLLLIKEGFASLSVQTTGKDN